MLVEEYYKYTGIQSVVPNNFQPKPRHLRKLRRDISHARTEYVQQRALRETPEEKAVRLQIENSINSERLGSIYRIPSDQPYIGRALEPASRNARRRDGRDGSQAELLEVAVPESQLPIREQIHLNRNGGVERTDNARNEIREERWEELNIPPPPSD